MLKHHCSLLVCLSGFGWGGTRRARCRAACRNAVCRLKACPFRRHCVISSLF
ncbi:hypothetical protein NEILACOT_05226 [Neisseria lactamica ATCC 23970]|uniref:Uncharacterized protein n=1 Tax=Neisseria lactamica ATCC 23970 TaxID=546265 RepID=D0WCE5_NEILA|nr:hypothetical protein NEILACOT_05226 [Neisseria lactamica ATCC 23970]